MGAESALRLFRARRRGHAIIELTRRNIALERSFQRFVERHLQALLGVQFLATEYATGVRHGGRIDTLGMDMQGNPVVIEYKRAASVNLISQGLFYLDWLDDHRGEFCLLVQERFGPPAARAMGKAARLICVASSFSHYDVRAVQQIGRRVELVQYGWYDDVLALVTVASSQA
jgi:RecB family endonuclease NucS